MRGIRIVLFNWGYFRGGSHSAKTDAHVDILSSHFLRITLQRSGHMHWLPGQSAYLTIPSVSGFRLEAHPFTISTINIPLKNVPNTTGGKEDTSDSASSESQDQGEVFKKLMFLIRVRSGFTERLLKAAGHSPTMKVVLDGPYSSPPLLRGFEMVILIAGSFITQHPYKRSLINFAGGSGVAFTLPLLLDIIKYVPLTDGYYLTDLSYLSKSF